MLSAHLVIPGRLSPKGVSGLAHKGMLTAAKVLARTAVEALSNDELVKQAAGGVTDNACWHQICLSHFLLVLNHR